MPQYTQNWDYTLTSTSEPWAINNGNPRFENNRAVFPNNTFINRGTYGYYEFYPSNFVGNYVLKFNLYLGNVVDQQTFLFLRYGFSSRVPAIKSWAAGSGLFFGSAYYDSIDVFDTTSIPWEILSGSFDEGGNAVPLDGFVEVTFCAKYDAANNNHEYAMHVNVPNVVRLRSAWAVDTSDNVDRIQMGSVPEGQWIGDPWYDENAYQEIGEYQVGSMEVYEDITLSELNDFYLTGSSTVQPGIVADPTFSLPDPYYTQEQYLSIECATQGSTIEYNLNETGWVTYTGQILLNLKKPYRFQARATKAGYTPSQTVSTRYQIVDTQQTIQGQQVYFNVINGKLWSVVDIESITPYSSYPGHPENGRFYAWSDVEQFHNDVLAPLGFRIPTEADWESIAPVGSPVDAIVEQGTEFWGSAPNSNSSATNETGLSIRGLGTYAAIQELGWINAWDYHGLKTIYFSNTPYPPYYKHYRTLAAGQLVTNGPSNTEHRYKLRIVKDVPVPTINLSGYYVGNQTLEITSSIAAQLEYDLGHGDGWQSYIAPLTLSGKRPFQIKARVQGDSNFASARVQIVDGFVTFLGEQYPYNLMPDGKIWFVDEIRHLGQGVSWNGSDPNNRDLGRFYALTEVLGWTLPGTWRIPTKQDADGLIQAVGSLSAQKLRDPNLAYWNTSPSLLASTNELGFNARGAGVRILETYYNKFTEFIIWTIPTTSPNTDQLAITNTGDNANVTYSFNTNNAQKNARLVMDVPPPVIDTPSGYYAGSKVIEITSMVGEIEYNLGNGSAWQDYVEPIELTSRRPYYVKARIKGTSVESSVHRIQIVDGFVSIVDADNLSSIQYPYNLMPDKRRWLLQNLRNRLDLAVAVNANGEGLYTQAICNSLFDGVSSNHQTGINGHWHIPEDDDYTKLFQSIDPDNDVAFEYLRDVDYNAGNNLFGMSLRPTGRVNRNISDLLQDPDKLYLMYKANHTAYLESVDGIVANEVELTNAPEDHNTQHATALRLFWEIAPTINLPSGYYVGTQYATLFHPDMNVNPLEYRLSETSPWMDYYGTDIELWQKVPYYLEARVKGTTLSTIHRIQIVDGFFQVLDQQVPYVTLANNWRVSVANFRYENLGSWWQAWFQDHGGISGRYYTWEDFDYTIRQELTGGWKLPTFSEFLQIITELNEIEQVKDNSSEEWNTLGYNDYGVSFPGSGRLRMSNTLGNSWVEKKQKFNAWVDEYGAIEPDQASYFSLDDLGTITHETNTADTTSAMSLRFIRLPVLPPVAPVFTTQTKFHIATELSVEITTTQGTIEYRIDNGAWTEYAGAFVIPSRRPRYFIEARAKNIDNVTSSIVSQFYHFADGMTQVLGVDVYWNQLGDRKWMLHPYNHPSLGINHPNDAQQRFKFYLRSELDTLRGLLQAASSEFVIPSYEDYFALWNLTEPQAAHGSSPWVHNYFGIGVPRLPQDNALLPTNLQGNDTLGLACDPDGYYLDNPNSWSAVPTSRFNPWFIRGPEYDVFSIQQQRQGVESLSGVIDYLGTVNDRFALRLVVSEPQVSIPVTITHDTFKAGAPTNVTISADGELQSVVLKVNGAKTKLL